MKKTVKHWSASYRKDVNKRCLMKIDEDLHKNITTDDTSNLTRDAMKILGKAARGVDIPVTRQEYTML